MWGPIVRRLAVAGNAIGGPLRRSTALVVLALAISLVAAVAILTVAGTSAQPATSVDRFFGDVNLRPPVGSPITATMGGNLCGQTTIQPGYKYEMDVVSSGQAAGCGTEGGPVDFTVAGIPAGSATWHAGDFTPLTLPVSPDLTPTPSPTTTPLPEVTPTLAAGWERVPLIEGCNRVAVTYADNTPSAAIRQAVFPEWIVRSIWKADAASGHWRGYSPLFPQVTDLAQAEFLDAVSICVTGPGAFARPLPGITPTPAPTWLTATPAPLPPDVESVALVGSACSDLTTTYTDNISVPWVIDPAVSPHEILVSIWKFDANMGWWLGYSPQFPEVSDLVTTDFLDAISICVTAAGTFTRPLTDAPPTPGPTLTPAPTPTRLADSDIDGCTDLQEQPMDFDRLAWYDFYDVPAPVHNDPTPNGTRDKAINVSDVVSVLKYAGTALNGDPVGGKDYDSDKNGDTSPDGRDYDRSPSPLPNPPYDAGPPDGVINVQDVVVLLHQAGLGCTEAISDNLFIDAPVDVGFLGADFRVALLNGAGGPVPGEAVECSLSPSDGPLAILVSTAVTGPLGDAAFSLIPRGVSCQWGQELNITCSLRDNPSEHASTKIVMTDCGGPPYHPGGPATPPNRFFGPVTINGSPAPAGTNVQARISGNICGQTTVEADSTYIMDVVSSGAVPGCGSEGTEVDFRVAATPVGAWTWSSGRFSLLDLPAPANTTPTPVPTPVSTPAPTPTAASGTETVGLVTGCNPIALTWPDHTPIQTPAGAVWPPEVLHAIWYNPVTGAWLGYSPFFPEASNLTEVQRLDAVFFCVDNPATLTRPIL